MVNFLRWNYKTFGYSIPNQTEILPPIFLGEEEGGSLESWLEFKRRLCLSLWVEAVAFKGGINRSEWARKSIFT